MSPPMLELLGVTAIAAPAAAAVLDGALALPASTNERAVSGVTATGLVASWLADVALVGATHFGERPHVAAGPLTLHADPLALAVAGTGALVSLVTAQFSSTYLHRERGYARFFALVALAAASFQLLTLSATLEQLVVGWELLGVASVLLIAFFDDRAAPLRGATRAFATYRIGDVGLMVAAITLHHHAGSAPLAAVGPVDGRAGLALGAALLLAAAAKSALFPLSGWLPRAMEGPTPSSALFYGGLSAHAGVYLLARAFPSISGQPVARGAIMLVGVVTALVGWSAATTRPDAKGRLAWAIVLHLGLMTALVGAGFTGVATAYLVGHLLLRTMQVLRSPSTHHDVRAVRVELGVVPSVARSSAAYRAAFHGLHVEGTLGRAWGVAAAALSWMDALDRRATARLLAERHAERATGERPADGDPAGERRPSHVTDSVGQ